MTSSLPTRTKNDDVMERESVLQVQLQTPSGGWVDVGQLHNLRETNWFDTSELYWQLPDRPVLGQVFEDRGRGWRSSARVALPTWFSHLLPEGRLRQAVARAARTNHKREFSLLARVGRADLPGAVRVMPVRPVRSPAVPEEEATENSVEAASPLLKFSLAGMQLKFSVHTGVKGLTLPANGQAGNVILKFPDGRAGFVGVPEAELACLTVAGLAGIPTPEAWLADPREVTGLEEWADRSSGSALAVTRFDRRMDDSRIHMEELAQVLDVPTGQESAKYRKANIETVANVVGALCGLDAVAEVIDRVVLNIMVGNGDAHLKNWAVVYDDGHTPTLSPVYDVLPTVLYIPEDDLGLKLGGSRQFATLTPSSFDRLGEQTGYGVAETRARIREAVGRIMTHWTVLKDYLTADQYHLLSARRDSLMLLKAA